MVTLITDEIYITDVDTGEKPEFFYEKDTKEVRFVFDSVGFQPDTGGVILRNESTGLRLDVNPEEKVISVSNSSVHMDNIWSEFDISGEDAKKIIEKFAELQDKFPDYEVQH